MPAYPAEHSVDQHRRGIKSRFMQALALFLAINAGLAYFGTIKFDPYKFNYTGWTWWTLHDLRQRGEIHNIALLGSSTMVSAIAGSDANYLNKPLNLTEHHRLEYLNDRLSKHFGGAISTFSLAAPGQMPSDAYLFIKAMVASANRPDVVIYGVAPRDFIDSTLAGPNDTEPFKYLTRIVNIDDVAGRVFRSPWARLDYFFGRHLFMYGYCLDFRMWAADLTTDFLNKIAPRPWTRTPFTWWDRMAMLPNYLPAEINPHAVISGPITKQTAQSSYKDNTKEYLQRYRSPDPQTYKTQMFFLRKLAEYCHKERMELILVNMPITYYNANMLQPGIYLKYVQSLKDFACLNDIVFYDLCRFEKYGQEDFYDSVHLNAFGGQKFFDNLVTAIISDYRPSMAISMSAIQLHHDRQLAESARRRPKPNSNGEIEFHM